MKRTIKLAVVAALALGTTSAFATNGSTLIGLGAKSRGMAGTAIGISHGAESALSNPALITGIKKDHEISFGGTLFMPDVESAVGTGSSETSAADMNMIPEVSLATKVNDNFYWGIGMWGTAGMGVDYRDTAAASGLMKMVTNLQLMQFGVPLAYTTQGFTVAVAPVLQYGALDINYDNNAGATNTNPPQDGEIGEGIAQDLQFGYNIGLSYEMKGLTIGAVYKSEIEMEYKYQLSSAAGYMGLNISDKLSTPAELGIGVSYKFGEHTVAIDYKQIKWSSASGYEDFNWDDQDVIALGYEYTQKEWAVRVGYNYASQPIQDDVDARIDTFNLIGFPAIVESHYAIGGTYVLNDTTSVDAAFTYAPETSVTLDYFTSGKIETKHSQTGVSVQLNYAF